MSAAAVLTGVSGGHPGVSNDDRRHIQNALVSSYTLLDFLGSGGYGAVYKASRPRFGDIVAVKVLRSSYFRDRTSLDERLSREGGILSRIVHSNIVRVDDVGYPNGVGYVAMEYYPDGSLRDLLNRDRTPMGSPDRVRLASNVVHQMLRALIYLDDQAVVHRLDVVHRDIKPENILYNSAQNKFVLSDFGIAQVAGRRTSLDDGGHEESLYLPGTVPYMPPEQMRGEPVDRRADLYALAVVGLEIVLGRVPSLGNGYPALVGENGGPAEQRIAAELNRVGFPEQAAAALMKCIEPDPDHRWQSPTDMMQALQ